MKILIINKFLFQNGGSETYIFKIGMQLRQMGNEVQYFGMEHKQRAVGNNKNLYTSEMDFHTKKWTKILYPFRIVYSREAKKKLYEVLNDFTPDAIHINNFNFQLTPSILYAIKKYKKKAGKGIKVIYTAHDSQLVCPNHLLQQFQSGEKCQRCVTGSLWNCARYSCIHGSRMKSVLGSLEAIIYRNLKTYSIFDTIICPSMFIKKMLDQNSIFKDKTHVLTNFSEEIDICQYRNNDKVPERYVLYFGRLSKEKGILTLLEVCKQLPDITFAFIGKGPLEGKLEGIKNVKKLGFLSGEILYQYIYNAEFCIFPSECYENCPFTILEAMECATPVIGADIGGIPELIHDQIDGEIFENGNIEDLKKKILYLWNHPETVEKYSSNCRKQKICYIQEYCEQLISIYSSQ